MKQRVFLLFALCLLLTLGACGGTQQDTASTAPLTAQAPSSTQTTTAATTTETATEPATQETTTAAFSLDDVLLTETPNSSCFSKIGYSDAHETLVLVFRNGGTYLYSGVPESVWQSFRAADSLGRYFNTKIKGNFPSEKV